MTTRISSFFQSALAKALGIGILALLLLIPTAFVQGLISERQDRLQEVQAEVGRSFGYPQVISGPVLAVPYRIVTVDEEKKTRQETWATAYILPSALDIQGTLTPEMRSRGIFDAVVYTGGLELTGTFRPDLSLLSLAPSDVRFADARLIVDITDGRGIQKNVTFTAGGKQGTIAPGSAVFHQGSVMAKGKRYSSSYMSSATSYENTDMNASRGLALVGPLAGYTGGELPFSFSLGFNGSEQLDIAPLGEETNVKLSGNWGKPSFIGSLLPTKSEVGESAFSAEWQVSQYGRGAPQAFTSRGDTPQPNMIALRLLSPVDFYVKTDRTVKYALLFIGLTFVAFFLSEVIRRLRVHPLQYLLIGFALALFFLLLLALSEHLGFGIAYTIASAATVSLITAYTASILGSARAAAAIGAMLTTLYLYLYLLLLLEEASLLFGALGLFAILAGIMWITRRIDWYHMGSGESEKHFPSVH